MSKPVLLCIDDELGGLEVRKMVLESAGYSVFTAGNGKDWPGDFRFSAS